jgi:hypothetical protein
MTVSILISLWDIHSTCCSIINIQFPLCVKGTWLVTKCFQVGAVQSPSWSSSITVFQQCSYSFDIIMHRFSANIFSLYLAKRFSRKEDVYVYLLQEAFWNADWWYILDSCVTFPFFASLFSSGCREYGASGDITLNWISIGLVEAVQEPPKSSRGTR